MTSERRRVIRKKERIKKIEKTEKQLASLGETSTRKERGEQEKVRVREKKRTDTESKQERKEIERTSVRESARAIKKGRADVSERGE